MYSVDGTAHLLTGDNVLDVLAVAQHLESIQQEHLMYSISSVPLPLSSLRCSQSSTSWAHYDDNKTWSVTRGVSSLRDAAVVVILRKFSEVIKSDSFEASAQYTDEAAIVDASLADNNDDKDISPQALLLQMCLEELETSQLATTYGIYETRDLKAGIKR
jgi:hypothetical protein